MINQTVFLNSSDMKDRHRNNKDRKWKGRYLSNSSNNDMKGRRLSSNLHLQWSSEEWNGGVKMGMVKICNVQMIITSVEQEEMVKR